MNLNPSIRVAANSDSVDWTVQTQKLVVLCSRWFRRQHGQQGMRSLWWLRRHLRLQWGKDVRGASWMPHDMRGFHGMLTDAMRPPWGDITNHGGGWVVGETRVRGLYSRNAAHGTPRAAMQATGSFQSSRSVSVMIGFSSRVWQLRSSRFGRLVDSKSIRTLSRFACFRRSLMPVAGVVQP